jgi:hypothetical protein
VCAFGLFGCDGAESHQHGAVDGASIEKKVSYNFLNAREFRWGKDGGVVKIRCRLRVFSLLGPLPSMWIMLGSAMGVMLETVQCFFHVFWHGNVDCAMGAIPCQGHSEVERSAPVGGDDVELLKSGEEMDGIVFVCVFDAKIINYKAKGDVAGGVGPDAGGVGARGVAVGGKVTDELVIG